MDGNPWQQLYDKGVELGRKYESGRNPEHFSEAIGNLQEALTLCPANASRRIDILDWLGWALGARYDREGCLKDLAEAIQYRQETLDLRGPGSPNRSYSLKQLAGALQTRYNREGNLEDLTHTIQYYREVLDLHGPGHANRLDSLDNLSSAIWTRYNREGNPEDLTQAIQYHREALDLRGPGHAHRSDFLNNHAIALQMRYEREGNLEDLAQVFQCHQEALDLRGPGHPDRSSSLNNLALALSARYKREGNLSDLAQAIEYYREALELRGSGFPDRSDYLNNLALALRTRSQLDGNLEDLTQAIEYHRETLDLRGPGHLNRPSSLINLAGALTTRYEREGNLEDLSQAIQYNQEALDTRGLGHPDRSMALNGLAVDLRMRYDQEGNLEDLVQAIQYYRESLDLRGPGHADRSMSLNNLGNALRTRYNREKNLDDLVQAIQHHREALDLRGPGHPDRFMSLNNLALAVEARYNRDGDLEYLAQAIQCRREALNLVGPGHPDRSASLNGMALLVHSQFTRLQSANNSGRIATPDPGSENVQPPCHANQPPTDYVSPGPLGTSIISLLREASQNQTGPPMACLRAALDWVRISKDVHPISTIEAYTTAFNQMDIILALGRSLGQRQDRLLSDNLVAKTQTLGGEAATWALQRGEQECAVELLEQSRTILLAQVGRYRVELDDLCNVEPGLADRFAQLSRLLDASVVADKRLGEESSAIKDPYGRYQKLSTEWNEVVDEIRSIPNFETFLKPTPYDRLRDAAAEGPIIIIIPNKDTSDALILHKALSEDVRIHHVPLPLANSSQLAELSNNFTQALDPMNSDKRMELLCLANLRVLWSMVVGPIAEALQHDLGIPLRSRVWWYPTSIACSLPLHAAGAYSEGQGGFLNLYISSYTPTFQALLRARKIARRSAPKKLLVVLQSTGSPDESQLPTPDNPPPLDFAMPEAEVIAETVSSTWEVKLMSDEEATCEAVQREMDSHPWVHFICHGNQVDDHPLDSFLCLSDGPLTLRKMIERNLPNADFAFLSACHSAAGDRALANEVLHMAAAVQFAGFRSVIGTLWEMRDEDGPPLAQAFYKEMMKYGDSGHAAVALNEAFKGLRRKDSEYRMTINGLMRFVHIGI